jgi:hypothetical protein
VKSWRNLVWASLAIDPGPSTHNRPECTHSDASTRTASSIDVGEQNGSDEDGYAICADFLLALFDGHGDDGTGPWFNVFDTEIMTCREGLKKSGMLGI